MPCSSWALRHADDAASGREGRVFVQLRAMRPIVHDLGVVVKKIPAQKKSTKAKNSLPKKYQT
jgi:hypothetical protein